MSETTRAKLADLEADKERLDWIESVNGIKTSFIVSRVNNSRIYRVTKHYANGPDPYAVGSTLREAIDELIRLQG